ncbi:hypothetical protein QJS10_CPA02g01195 [Acorus calamus]|uniref:Uncharacterized protein n=1 Tax=Acorus calamus TaxID=4465 RepID=A0AAV9FD34_ACOCL|nr:hypothetical protein QJS10_CPA02g01195 [Acorus calamus]
MEDDLDLNMYRGRDSSFKHKLRSSCFGCFFRSSSSRRGGPDSPPADGGGGGDDRPRLIRSSSAWIRSRAQELPELRDKCRNLISRIGRGRSTAVGRTGGGDFRYDPLSYALNFDEGDDDDDSLAADEFRYRNFSSRLPASPLPPPVAATAAQPREIAC